MQQKKSDKTPDWEAIAKTVTGKYDAIYADRTVTRAKIILLLR